MGYELDEKHIERFWKYVEKGDPAQCWPWLGGKINSGYGRFNVYNDHGHYAASAHRVALELKLGRKIRDGFMALHSCDNRSCCNPNHLSEGTALQNSQDMYAKGRARHMHGEAHYRAKLTTAQVIEILHRIGMGARTRDLAKEFGVSQSSISEIKHGRRWIKEQQEHVELYYSAQPTEVGQLMLERVYESDEVQS